MTTSQADALLFSNVTIPTYFSHSIPNILLPSYLSYHPDGWVDRQQKHRTHIKHALLHAWYQSMNETCHTPTLPASHSTPTCTGTFTVPKTSLTKLLMNVHAVDLIEAPGSRPPPSIILIVAMLNL